MASYTLNINNKNYEIEADPAMPLLWAIRDFAGLTGTKFGCGIAQCGACTVHFNGNPVYACSIPVSAAASQKITTIEGLSAGNDHPVQKAWIEEQVPQCGYCHSGQIMAAAALLKRTPNPTDKDIDMSMRIRKAIKSAAKMMKA